MTKEYIVYYLVNGEGYKKGLPWIQSKTNNFEDAKLEKDDIVSESDRYNTYEAWIEEREVGEWRRVD